MCRIFTEKSRPNVTVAYGSGCKSRTKIATEINSKNRITIIASKERSVNFICLPLNNSHANEIFIHISYTVCRMPYAACRVPCSHAHIQMQFKYLIAILAFIGSVCFGVSYWYNLFFPVWKCLVLFVLSPML